MKKTPEQSFEEMMLRNERSQLQQAAFTFWRESNYDKKDEYDKFKRFSRWFDPSWTLPDHVQPIVDLFEKNFASHKIIVTDKGQGVEMHLNPSRSDIARDWKKWHTWSYTMCVPFDLNAEYDPVVMLYGNYIDDVDSIKGNPCANIDVSKYKVMLCKPFDRISFPSSKYAHGVCSSSNRMFWILNDMSYSDQEPHKNIDVKTITSTTELDEDMKRVINYTKPNGEKYLTHQFMSDLDFFLSFNKEPTELDWIPPNL